MKETKYTVKYTTSFKKDYKRAITCGLKIEAAGAGRSIAGNGRTAAG